MLIDPSINKQRIVDQIRKYVAATRGGEKLHRSCLWYAIAAIEVLQLHGIEAQLQAGDASFLVIPDELDDGVSPTHYSYVSESDSWDAAQIKHEAIQAIVTEKLPEIHVWVGMPARNEVLDLTTKYVPQLAREAGLECQIVMPDYVWDDVVRLSNTGFLYQPTMNATMLAMFLADRDDNLPQRRRAN